MTITRGEIEQSVVEAKMIDETLGYLELSRFTEGADNQFKQKLDELREQGMQELILDLRGNPGGGLDVAISIANQVVPEGKVVYIEDREGNRDSTFHSQLPARDFELAVLVDENSASASEILAAALQDHEAATILGNTTFGKGSVQRRIYLQDQTALLLTVQNFLGPQEK